MKVAIISDLHLGFRQYGSLEREVDFYEQLYRVRDEINKCNPDMVIIAGDLFDKPNPSPAAINAYKEGIGNLSADIVCAIKGNHTMVLRDNHFSIDDFFGSEEFEGYYYLDDSSVSGHEHAMASPYDNEFKKYIDTKVHVDGITYRYNSDIDEFLEVQKQMASKCPKDSYNILVVHQSFKEFCGFIGEELSIEDIDYSPYDIVICGHIHSRFDTVLSDGTKFVQPGSIERMNTTEALDEQKNGKGFYLLDTDKNSLVFNQVKCPREFLLGNVKFESKEDLEKHLVELDDSIKKSELSPIISYKYENYGLNIDAVREKVGLVEENVLLNKSHIDDKSNEEVVLDISEDGMPSVVEAIKMYGEETGLNDDECSLAADLYTALTGNAESVDKLLDDYLKKHKKNVQQKDYYDKELEETIEYFGEE